MALVPRFEPDEDRTKVRLIRARDGAIAADRLIRLDAFGLAQNLFDLLEHFAGARERSAGRELNVDAQDPLIFIRYESRLDAPGKETGPDNDCDHDSNRDDSTADKQSRGAHIAIGDDLKYFVEAAEENSQRSPRLLRRFEHQSAQRRRQRQRVES